MAIKKLVSDLTEGLVAYPNHNTPSDSGGFNYGSSTSVFDTKTFNQRGFFYTNFNNRQENPAPLIPQLLPEVNQEPENSILYLDDAPIKRNRLSMRQVAVKNPVKYCFIVFSLKLLKVNS